MFWRKLLGAFGIQLIEVDRREKQVRQNEWNQLDKELEHMRGKCLEAARKRYFVDGVRLDDITVGESQPDEIKAQNLGVIYADRPEGVGKSLKERLLNMCGLEVVEVQVYVAECRLRKRIACRALGATWVEAYGALWEQLRDANAELDGQAPAVAARAVRAEAIELSGSAEGEIQ
ncbi:MAG: hypothetical protein NVSMB1_13280 [Polyangiales bacterium]